MRIELAAVLIGVLVAGATPAVVLAQQQPQPFPWEKKTDDFFTRGVPKIDNPIDRRIDEGLRSLGIPPQPKLDITKDAPPPPEPPGLSETVLPRLDTNHDGVVSAQEYRFGRQRPVVAGEQGTLSGVRRTQRLNSRFRAADRNRDGRLSASEIDAMKGRRF